MHRRRRVGTPTAAKWHAQTVIRVWMGEEKRAALDAWSPLSPWRKANCLQERCERAQARCSRRGLPPWRLSEQHTSVEAGRVLPFSTSARRKIEAELTMSR